MYLFIIKSLHFKMSLRMAYFEENIPFTYFRKFVLAMI